MNETPKNYQEKYRAYSLFGDGIANILGLDFVASLGTIVR
jgi:hypothetical protein